MLTFMSDVTRILSAIEQGDPHAAEQLLPLVYDELRELAAQRLAREKHGQTLQATALVHEAYLRLVGDQHFDNRGHFFAAAAESMRRILVDRAREKAAIKRGGGLSKLNIDDINLVSTVTPDQLLAIDDALAKLEVQDAPAGQLVRLRYFAGLTVDEAGQAMGISTTRPTGTGILPGRGCTANYKAVGDFKQFCSCPEKNRPRIPH
jgi:RNA polymerase sigma factor (TIGR02999 family)